MTKLTKEDVELINDKSPYNQGVFNQPYGIPVSVKEDVIYSRWDRSGTRGGSCWDDCNPEPYRNEEPKDHFKVLEYVLEVVRPEITFLQYKRIQELIHDNNETEYEYYGNSTDWKIEYIKLSDFYALIESL